LATYASMSRSEIIWSMPLSVGLRLQNAYIARNSDQSDRPDVNADRYSYWYNKILREDLQ